jgi:uncharacterized membrane protein
VLALEPVVVLTVIRAVLVLAGAVLAGFGLAVPATFEPWLVGVVVAFYAVVEAVTAAVTRARATPNAKVVQTVEPDGTVVAGPASALPTGTRLDAAETEDAVLSALDDAQQAGAIAPGADLIDIGAHVTSALAAKGITPST